VLDVVCWKWKPARPYRSTFTADSVNTLYRMVLRHLRLPFRFSCITDDATGIDPNIRVIPLWGDYASIPNPSSPSNPSCYRRLKMFSEEAKDIIGERILSMDLDTVITGDITHLVTRREDFVAWGGHSVSARSRMPYSWYNGSFMLLKAGTRTRVWTEFDPHVSPARANAAGCRGSDQGWITYCLGRGEAVWTAADGIYSYRVHCVPRGGRMPPGARMVAFHGRHDPWDPAVQRVSPWIRNFYR